MTKRRRLVLNRVGVLWLALGVAAGPAVQAADPLRDQRWRDDLQFLATELPGRHINFFANVTRQDFNQAVSDLNQAIPDETDPEVVVGLARLVAMAGDAHTNLALPQAAARFAGVGVRFLWFQEGLYVTITAPEFARALGARVIRIGDVDTNEVYRRVATIISHENDAWVRQVSPGYLVLPDVLRALKIVPADAQTVQYALVDSTGSQFSLDLPPLTASVQGVALPDASSGFTALYRQKSSQNYWFQYLESSRTLYFKYNVCAEMPGVPFADFASQMFGVMDANPVERVVFDVRNNEGGDSRVIQPFVDGMIPRLTRFRVFVIIGRETFSSGLLAVIPGKGAPNTLLVGEPTGGKPNAFGEVQTFTLPNSQLLVRYSTKVFSFPALNTESLLPDISVAVTASDYFARHDAFLAAVMAWEAP